MADSPARAAGRRGLVIPCLLAASLACNVAALVIPFMEMDVFLRGTTVYSLPRSVHLLWEQDLYAIAGLVVAFSIAFPFAKLAGQAWIWFGARRAGREALLPWLERLGKWSFLDIFIVCVLLILTSDQTLIDAEPRIGLYTFVAAIGLSMVSAALIAAFVQERRDRGGERRVIAARPGWPRLVVPALIVASGAAIAAALATPFLRIDQLLLADHTFSVARSITALWSESFYGAATLVAATLVVMPVTSVLVAGVVWFAPLTAAGRRRCRRALELVWQWAMLDVFALGLLVFILEGRALIKTEIQPGLFVLLGAVFVLTALQTLVVWLSAAPERVTSRS